MTKFVVPEHRRYLLEAPELAHMATIGPNGEPQNNPVWFLWQGDRFIVAIGAEGQKARNLGRDPHVAFSIVDSSEPLHYLEVRGTAVESQTVGSDDPTVIAMVRKYTGSDTYSGEPDTHTLFFIEATHFTTMG